VTRLPALDGLRAVAAAMVVLTHAAYLTGATLTLGLPGRLMGRGDFGVAVFFALSGFLLHQRLLHDRQEGAWDVRGYLLRRFARVLPAYWVVLLVVTVTVQPPVRTVVAQALAVQTYVPGTDVAAFSQSWSVPTELAFYLALPLVVVGLEWLRSRDERWPLRALLLSSLVLLVLLAVAPPGRVGEDVLVERWLPARWPDFAVGMALAEVAVYGRTTWAARIRDVARDTTGCLAVAAAALVLATTSVGGLLTLGPASGVQLGVRHALSAVVAGALLAPLAVGQGGWWAEVLAPPPVRWVGTVSYGLFLWHLPVFTALLAVSGVRAFTGGLVPLLALGLPLSLALAWASHRFVELPGMRRAARRAPMPRVPHRR
jgi:peptidoglycan/LPS O-acetylase OafA/YrhL